MPLRVREVRAVFMDRFQSVLLGLACRRGDGSELRARQMSQAAQASATSKQMEEGT